MKKCLHLETANLTTALEFVKVIHSLGIYGDLTYLNNSNNIENFKNISLMIHQSDARVFVDEANRLNCECIKELMTNQIINNIAEVANENN